MITGAHFIIYSTDTKKDRDFFRDILKLTSIDLGGGWLIFGLPPAEVAIHPSASNELREFYFLCEDIELFVKAMKTHHIICTAIQDQRWGLLTQITLPGGGKIGVYQPRHARPAAMKIPKRKKKNRAITIKKSIKKPARKTIKK
jgi:hypothetical protein